MHSHAANVDAARRAIRSAHCFWGIVSNRLKEMVLAPVPHRQWGFIIPNEYISRCPFSLTRMVSLTENGKILYRASKPGCIPFPMTFFTALAG